MNNGGLLCFLKILKLGECPLILAVKKHPNVALDF